MAWSKVNKAIRHHLYRLDSPRVLAGVWNLLNNHKGEISDVIIDRFIRSRLQFCKLLEQSPNQYWENETVIDHGFKSEKMHTLISNISKHRFKDRPRFGREMKHGEPCQHNFLLITDAFN